jgi:uncharacterized protein YecE (DUF72 family)
MYYIGCSGYYYWYWKERFYPESLPQSKWFQHYTKYFDTVELNSPFYRWPKPDTPKSWYRNAPEGFVYTIKVNRRITHIKKFKDTKQLIKDFYKLGDDLIEKMGCYLFQLPPNLKFSEGKLKEITSQLNSERKNVIEFRHESWFNAEVYEEFKKNNIIFCILSSPSMPEDFVKTADDIYIRFHGKRSLYASNYSNKELGEWVKKIKKSSAKNSWAYFNNDANAFAVKNALEFKKLLL